MCPLTKDINVEHGGKSVPHLTIPITAELWERSKTDPWHGMLTHVDHAAHILERFERDDLPEEVERRIPRLSVGE